MADTKLTIEQSMEESKVAALRELVLEIRQMKQEIQHIRVQLTNLVARK